MTHTNLGGVLAARGDRNGAIAEYRTALRLEPGDALAHHNLGMELWAIGGREAASEEFYKAYRLAPNHPTVRKTYENLLRLRSQLR